MPRPNLPTPPQGAARQLLRGTLLGTLLGAAMAAGAQTPAEEQGRRAFDAQCSACHSIGGGDRVGPDLLGVTERRDAAWLRVHIATPSVHREQGDPIALELVAAYGMSMPDLRLPEAQIDAVMAYLATTAPGQQKGAPALFVPTLVAGGFAIVALSAIGLFAGTKKVEVR